MKRNVIPAVLCYLRKNGRTLMLLRNKKENDIHEGKYNGLGGKFEAGESPQDCARREVFEESGLRIKNPALRGVLTFPSFDGKNDWLVFVFTAGIFSGRQKECPEGKLVWVRNEDVLKLNLWEGDYIFLRHIDRPCFFSGRFVYRHKKLISWDMDIYPFEKKSGLIYTKIESLSSKKARSVSRYGC